MSDMITVKLEDEIELLYGKSLTSKNRKSGEVPVYGSNGVVDYHNEHCFEGPGIIIGRKGTVGAVKFSRTKFWAIDTTYVVNMKRENDSIRYWYYFLKTIRLEKMNTHSAVPGLNRKAAYMLEIKVFKDVRVRAAIAEYLTTLDSKIEVNNQINKTLENMAQTIFKQWFVDFEFPNEDGKPYKSSGGEMIESELGMIPEVWEVMNVSDICEVGSSKRIFAKEYVNEGIPFYRSKEVIKRSKGNDASTELFITKEKYLMIKEKFPVPVEGDMLLTSVGTLGVPYLVGDEEIYFKDGNLTWFREFKKDGYRNYIYLWILSKQGKEEIDAVTIGSTQKALTISVLKKIKIFGCNDELLDKFESITSSLISVIKSKNKENSKLIQLRNTLLPKLMSGEIRVPLETKDKI